MFAAFSTVLGPSEWVAPVDVGDGHFAHRLPYRDRVVYHVECVGIDLSELYLVSVHARSEHYIAVSLSVFDDVAFHRHSPALCYGCKQTDEQDCAEQY